MIGMTALGAIRPALRAEGRPTRRAPSTPRLLFSANSAATAIQEGDQTKTIWSGVFTDDQAKRGRELYNKWCQSCHGAELSGGEMAPPLAGSTFITNWDGQTVGDLEERVRVTMPQGDEGTLSHQQVVDILSAVFAANGAPSGDTELPKDVPILKTIQITAKK